MAGDQGGGSLLDHGTGFRFVQSYDLEATVSQGCK